MRDDLEKLGRLRPEKKVDIAIDMINASTRICASGIREQNPGISDEELIIRLRERISWSKRRHRS
jgi:hypothetical protein